MYACVFIANCVFIPQKVHSRNADLQSLNRKNQDKIQVNIYMHP